MALPSDLPPSQEAYLGKTDGQWPTTIFPNEDAAARWLDEQPPSGQRRHVWKVRIDYEREMLLVPPASPRLKPKPRPGETT